MTESKRITELKKEKRILMSQVAAAQAQLEDTLNEADKPNLEDQIKRFTERFVQASRELIKQELGVANPTELDRKFKRDWKEGKHQINWSEPTNKFEQKMRSCFQPKTQSATALFITDECKSMLIENFLLRVRDWLQKDTYFKNYALLPEYKITFDVTDLLNEKTFITRLRSNLGIKESHVSLAEILQTIVENFHEKSIRLITIEIQCKPPEGFFQWLQQHFWIPLNLLTQDRALTTPRVGIVAFVYTYEPIFPHLVSSELCCETDHQKFLPLKFSDWSPHDLTDWFEVHTKLVEIGKERNLWDRVQFDKWCEELCNMFGGKPENIFSNLEKMYMNKARMIVERVNYDWNAAN